MTDTDTTEDQAADETTEVEQDQEQESAEQEQEQPDTFPREYVEQLRGENARYRTDAKKADDLAHRLHTELVRATGKLADPTDLPFDAEHLDDPDKLTAAVESLIEAKPHLKARTIAGNVGQGEQGADGGVNLLDLMRGRA